MKKIKNNKKNTLNIIPQKLISHEIILSKCNIKTIFSFSSSCKEYRGIIIKEIKGLWSRNITSALIYQPHLIFIQFIDGYIKKINAFKKAEYDFKKYHELFNPLDPISKHLNDSQLNHNNILALDYIHYEANYTDKSQTTLLTHLKEAFESIHNLYDQIFWRITLVPAAAFIDGFLLLPLAIDYRNQNISFPCENLLKKIIDIDYLDIPLLRNIYLLFFGIGAPCSILLAIFFIIRLLFTKEELNSYVQQFLSELAELKIKVQQ